MSAIFDTKAFSGDKIIRTKCKIQGSQGLSAYSQVPDKRPWPNNRPGWKNDSKLINVQRLITVQGEKLLKLIAVQGTITSKNILCIIHLRKVGGSRSFMLDKK